MLAVVDSLQLYHIILSAYATEARHDLFVLYNIDHPYTIIKTSKGVVNIIEDK